jgi:hypothetical protein
MPPENGTFGSAQAISSMRKHRGLGVAIGEPVARVAAEGEHARQPTL